MYQTVLNSIKTLIRYYKNFLNEFFNKKIYDHNKKKLFI